MVSDSSIVSSGKDINGRQRLFLWIWSTVLILVLCVIGWSKVSPLWRYKRESAERHRARMSFDNEEAGHIEATARRYGSIISDCVIAVKCPFSSKLGDVNQILGFL